MCLLVRRLCTRGGFEEGVSLDVEMSRFIALVIEMGADAVDIGKTIYPHTTLIERIGMAAEVAHGSCMDLPPNSVVAWTACR